MTEREWLACTDPQTMLESLRGKATERKLRLFACASCRRLWHLLTDEKGRKAVETAERFADGAAGEEERSAAFTALMAAAYATPSSPAGATNPSFRLDWASPALLAAAIAVKTDAECLWDGWTGKCIDGAGAPHSDGIYRALGLCHHAAHAAGHHAIRQARRAQEAERRTIRSVWDAVTRSVRRALGVSDPFGRIYRQAFRSEQQQQAAILNDLFGPLPCRPVAFDPAWLVWNDGAVARLAWAVYDERAFNRLPILADTLEEAGCTTEPILSHCRGPGEHVRGCWVLDLILGRE
jgi:hypothetical protein